MISVPTKITFTLRVPPESFYNEELPIFGGNQTFMYNFQRMYKQFYLRISLREILKENCLFSECLIHYIEIII